MPFVGRAKDHVKLVFLRFCLFGLHQIVAPKLRHGRAHPTQVLPLGIVWKAIVVIGCIHLNGNAPLPLIAQTECLVGLRLGLAEGRRSMPAKTAMMAITTSNSIT